MLSVPAEAAVKALEVGAQDERLPCGQRLGGRAARHQRRQRRRQVRSIQAQRVDGRGPACATGGPCRLRAKVATCFAARLWLLGVLAARRQPADTSPGALRCCLRPSLRTCFSSERLSVSSYARESNKVCATRSRCRPAAGSAARRPWELQELHTHHCPCLSGGSAAVATTVCAAATISSALTACFLAFCC